MENGGRIKKQTEALKSTEQMSEFCEGFKGEERMKKFMRPEMKIMSLRMSENIAASGDGTGVCSLGREYSPNKQECQNCKIYHLHYGTVPAGIDFSGAIKTFSDRYGLGYADKESAINAANSLACPEGK